MNKNSLMLVIFLFNYNCLFAQEISGTARYNKKTVVKDLKISSNIESEFKQSIQRQYARGINEEFNLEFTNDESIYGPKIIYDNQINHKEGEVYIKNGNHHKLYRNLKTEQVLFESNVLGKNVLVRDSIYNWAWKLEDEIQEIDGYQCKKATRTFEPHNHSGEKRNTKNASPHIVTVWYALDIPISHGPGIYYGLPGLILQVEDGNSTIKIEKLKIDKKPRKIKIPTNSRTLSKKDFDEIAKQSCNCDKN